jgi:hypothetical protein
VESKNGCGSAGRREDGPSEQTVSPFFRTPTNWPSKTNARVVSLAPLTYRATFSTAVCFSMSFALWYIESQKPLPSQMRAVIGMSSRRSEPRFADSSDAREGEKVIAMSLYSSLEFPHDRPR